MRLRSSIPSIALLLLAAPQGLSAQEVIEPEVAAVEQHTEGVVLAAPSEDVTSLAAALGGTLNQGNTEAWQLTTGADFNLIRLPHAVTATARFAYGQTNAQDDDLDEYVDTVRNFNSRLRYDFFLTSYDALFAAGVYRWDTFAGLDHRMQGQLGYLRLFIKGEKHRLWGEAGYDLTYDNFDPDPLVRVVPNPAFDATIDSDMDDGVDDNGNTATLNELLPGTQTVHSARIFLGYDNQLNEHLTYVGGAELLLNVEDMDDYRINWDNAVRSSINSSLKLELKVTVQYDHLPVEGKKDTDLMSVISIIYALI